MAILVTGAAGVLGGEVARRLAGRCDLRTTDLIAAEAPGAFAQADLVDYEAVLSLVNGCNVVVHCAAIHPWKKYTDEQYLDCNVKATYQVAKACVEARVERLVFASSIAAVGYYSEWTPEVMPVQEHIEPRTHDVYGLTKTLAEEAIRMFHRKAGLKAFCLRPNTFIPMMGIEEGLALLSGWHTDYRDIARAHVLAVDAPLTGVEAVFLTSGVPYTPEDFALSQSDPGAALERYYPGIVAWLAERGVEPPAIAALYSREKARRLLGWEPDFTFDRWWQENRA